MARVEILIGAFLTGWGLWFFQQTCHLPSAAISYGHLPYLIPKLASTAGLFLGLGLIARALILSPETTKTARPHPLKIMPFALLILTFFLLAPKSGSSARVGLLFPLLVLFSVKERWEKITTPTMILALMVWAAYGLMGTGPLPR